MADNRSHADEQALEYFLELMREPHVAAFAGRGAQLSHEELRSVFGIAQLAMKRSRRKDKRESRSTVSQQLLTENTPPSQQPAKRSGNCKPANPAGEFKNDWA